MAARSPLEGLPGGSSGSGRRLGHPGGRQVRPDLQRPGVQGHERYPVAEHVVHLLGDPGPFGAAGLLGQQFLRRLGVGDLLAQ